MRNPLIALLLLVPPTAFASSAGAIVIEDASANNSAPADDPGWDNVGRIAGNLNAVYLGHGWAATVDHSSLASGEAVFAERSYPIVPGSAVQIEHDASHDADLQVFRIYPYPHHLPALELATGLALGDDAMLIASGGTNGGAVGDPPTGYAWGPAGVRRWGTNHLGGSIDGRTYLSTVVAYGAQRTRSLVVQFDPAGSAFEAGVAEGDSGGALFADGGEGWQLAGILWATTGAIAGETHYGDDALAADLGYTPYRSQVLGITRPCDDGEDDDGDLLVDLDDPGCRDAGDLSEEPACRDGLDNDADGAIDLGDADCGDAEDGLEAPDRDGDGAEDWRDNCIETANPDQLDANLDGYGNACDADFNDDGAIGIPDFMILASRFGSVEGDPRYDPVVDPNGDGAIGMPDFHHLVSVFGEPPGPSGLDCAGVPPCF